VGSSDNVEDRVRRDFKHCGPNDAVELRVPWTAGSPLFEVDRFAVRSSSRRSLFPPFIDRAFRPTETGFFGCQDELLYRRSLIVPHRRSVGFLNLLDSFVFRLVPTREPWSQQSTLAFFLAPGAGVLVLDFLKQSSCSFYRFPCENLGRSRNPLLTRICPPLFPVFGQHRPSSSLQVSLPVRKHCSPFLWAPRPPLDFIFFATLRHKGTRPLFVHFPLLPSYERRFSSCTPPRS